MREARARHTRAAVLTAAQDLFTSNGYRSTSMRAVARAAGVSVQAVELIFGTKATLLKAIIDVAVAGDDEPVPMLQRGVLVDAPLAADVAAFARRFAAALRPAAHRVGPVLSVLHEAAASDPELQAVVATMDRQRTVMARWVVDRLIEYAPLRLGLDRRHAVDIVWIAMDPFVHRRLTTVRRWSGHAFEDWFCRMLVDLVDTRG